MRIVKKFALLITTKRVFLSKYIPHCRFHLRRYSYFSKVRSKIAILRFLAFLIVWTLLFGISQTASRSDFSYGRNDCKSVLCPKLSEQLSKEKKSKIKAPLPVPNYQRMKPLCLLQHHCLNLKWSKKLLH